uniref:Putative reverse transcriptase domain-containing protein n=1 Tax=Tanacetum cinerariifolium TaxID=118510 RepID=A0A6L2K5C2_TANCI|nr:putative reverse transcriptase domain-containing protein [Tanacetum cinerariifolium]
MNGKTYRCVLCYQLGVPLFFVSKLCSACSRVFMRDIYGDHAYHVSVLLALNIGITLYAIPLSTFALGRGFRPVRKLISGLWQRRDKPLRLADMLLYSWDRGLDVYVDLTGLSPLTQTGMVDFVAGHEVTGATHHKRVKHETKCSDIGYGFLLFSFSFLGELEKDAVTLLKRIQKFSTTQDIGARATVHILIGLALL